MTLKICILETDIIRPELIDQYQSYGRMFEQLFSKQSIPAQFEVFNVVDGVYPGNELAYDAYLITGSKADSFGTDPWIERLRVYLLDRYQRGDKLLGVCFGHQLLALLLGGKSERATQGWGLGVHRYQLTEKSEWMSPQLEELSMLISHQDQVTRLPDNATLIASSEFCPHAAFAMGDQVLCFQGHPEFIPEYSRALLDLRQSVYGSDLYQRAVATLDQHHQGATVAEWMMRFVAKGRTEAC